MSSTLEILITGEWATWFIRHHSGTDAMRAFPQLTGGQIVAIWDHKARLEGDSRDGFRYVES